VLPPFSGICTLVNSGLLSISIPPMKFCTKINRV
jgi:hypothetical protein